MADKLRRAEVHMGIKLEYSERSLSLSLSLSLSHSLSLTHSLPPSLLRRGKAEGAREWGRPLSDSAHRGGKRIFLIDTASELL